MSIRSKSHRLNLSSCWGLALPADEKGVLLSVLMGLGRCVSPRCCPRRSRDQKPLPQPSALSPVKIWEPELLDMEPKRESGSTMDPTIIIDEDLGAISGSFFTRTHSEHSRCVLTQTELDLCPCFCCDLSWTLSSGQPAFGTQEFVLSLRKSHSILIRKTGFKEELQRMWKDFVDILLVGGLRPQFVRNKQRST